MKVIIAYKTKSAAPIIYKLGEVEFRGGIHFNIPLEIIDDNGNFAGFTCKKLLFHPVKGVNDRVMVFIDDLIDFITIFRCDRIR